MGVILICIGVILLVGSLLTLTVKIDEGEWNKAPMIATSIFGGVISVIIVFSIWLSLYYDTGHRIKDYENFINYNLPELNSTVSSLEQGLNATHGDGYILDASNFQQIEAYKEAVKDRRDAIMEYNESIVNHRYWQDNFLIGLFYQNLPDDITEVNS